MSHNHFSVWVLVPPRFVAELESQAVLPKSAVLFRSVFEGTPPFTVKWFKDDVELITGPSCTIKQDRYSSSVELNSVATVQSGVYSCQVINEAGTVKSAAELLVKGWTLLFLSSTITSHLTPSFFFIFTAPLLPPFLSIYPLPRDIYVVFRVICHLSWHPVICPHPPSITVMSKCLFMLTVIT